MHTPTHTQPLNDNSNTTQFIPELDGKEIKALQQAAAHVLSLPPYFEDDLKTGGQGPELAIIPAGQYEMGSSCDEFGHSIEEYPQHYTHITKPFAIGRFTITADDFEKFREDTEWFLRNDLIWSEGLKPVINIRMADADLYIE